MASTEHLEHPSAEVEITDKSRQPVDLGAKLDELIEIGKVQVRLLAAFVQNVADVNADEIAGKYLGDDEIAE